MLHPSIQLPRVVSIVESRGGLQLWPSAVCLIRQVRTQMAAAVEGLGLRVSRR